MIISGVEQGKQYIMDMTQGEVYRGYTFWKRESVVELEGNGQWGAYMASPSTAWFQGHSPEELVEQIDKAYAELPVPVY